MEDEVEREEREQRFVGILAFDFVFGFEVGVGREGWVDCGREEEGRSSSEKDCLRRVREREEETARRVRVEGRVERREEVRCVRELVPMVVLPGRRVEMDFCSVIGSSLWGVCWVGMGVMGQLGGSKVVAGSEEGASVWDVLSAQGEGAGGGLSRLSVLWLR